MEINTKMHWLELSTMIHVVRKHFSDRVTVLDLLTLKLSLYYGGPEGSTEKIYISNTN